jgi:hypothetical protein
MHLGFRSWGWTGYGVQRLPSAPAAVGDEQYTGNRHAHLTHPVHMDEGPMSQPL